MFDLNYPKWLRLSPVSRILIFIPLMLITVSLPWAYYAGKDVVPVKFLAPFSRYLIERYVYRLPESERVVPVILQVFVGTPDLKHLAIPPSMGGPHNQMVFVVLGWSLLLVLTLMTTPIYALQVAGLIVSISTVFGFIMAMSVYEKVGVLDNGVGVYAHFIVSIIGLFTVF